MKLTSDQQQSVAFHLFSRTSEVGTIREALVQSIACLHDDILFLLNKFLQLLLKTYTLVTLNKCVGSLQLDLKQWMLRIFIKTP